jgi:hypothetical protein
MPPADLHGRAAVPARLALSTADAVRMLEPWETNGAR